MARRNVLLGFAAFAFCVLAFGNVSFGSLFFQTGGTDNNLTFRSAAGGPTTVNTGPTTPLPLVGSLMNGTATANYDYENSGPNAGIAISSFNYSLVQGQFAEMLTTFRITPTVDLTYKVSGNIHWSGIFGSPTLFARIQDITVSEFSPTDITLFTLSGSGTNNFNKSIPNGSPMPTTGTLFAGHIYKLVFDIAADTSSVNNTGVGTATGNAAILLSGNDPNPSVPEPATITIWAALGCVGMVFYRWRKR
jgi:hypothetical protein